MHRVLNDKGNKIGVPVKSSLIHNNKPGLTFLEAKFQQNETARQPHKLRIKNEIDLALFKNPNHSLASLIQTLQKEGINTVIRQNTTGIIYGITTLITELNQYLMEVTREAIQHKSDSGKMFSPRY